MAKVLISTEDQCFMDQIRAAFREPKLARRLLIEIGLLQSSDEVKTSKVNLVKDNLKNCHKKVKQSLGTAAVNDVG